MKHLAFLFIGFLILMCGKEVQAQQDPINGFFMMTPLKFNPAIVGTTDRTSFSAVYRNQWTSIEGAPVNYYFSMNTPVMRTVKPQEDMYTIFYPTGLSAGFTLGQDNIGVSKLFKMSVPIGVKVRIGKSGSRLSFGIKPSLNVTSSDISELEQDPGESFKLDWKETYVDFDFGFYFYNTRWYLSTSMTNVRDVGSLLDYGYVREQHYFLSAGYVFGITNNIMLRATALSALVSHSPASVTINPSLIIDNKITAGVAYRYKDMLGLTAGYNFGENFRLGYIYEYPTSGKTNKIGSTHEILVQYVLNKGQNWVASPRYFW